MGCRGVAPRSSALQADAITQLARSPYPSPRPESNRSLPLTGRALDHRAARAVGSSGRTRTFIVPVNSRLPLHSASLEYYGGDLGQTSPEIPTGWRQVFNEQVPQEAGQTTPSTRGASPCACASANGDLFASADPGAGFEPAFLGPEPSVLPLDDPGMLLLSGSGGS